MDGRINRGRIKCGTDVQERRAAEIAATGRDVYLEKVQGKGVVAAWERYLDQGDAEKITPALYHLLTMRCGFIAHFNLHGFRHVYGEPLDLLNARSDGLTGRAPHGGNIDYLTRYPSEYVYKDGMTAGEALEQMAAISDRLKDLIVTRAAARERRRDLATAAALAAKHGMTLGDGEHESSTT